MTTEQKQVAEWMEKAQQGCPDKPTIPSLEIRKLRARLILEEALETIHTGLGISVYIENSGYLWPSDVGDEFEVGFDQHTQGDLTQIADGLADLQYVTLGTAVACGLDMEPIFAEVCRSNESKWWNSSEVNGAQMQASNTMNFIEIENSVNARWCVTDKGGKVIKSPSYSPANIAPIIERQN